jgi:2-dehydropantoate 2-reductase
MVYSVLIIIVQEKVIIGMYRPNDYTTTVNTPREVRILEKVTSILVAGGSETTYVPEVQRVKFIKNLRNIAFNGFTALTRSVLYFPEAQGYSDH